MKYHEITVSRQKKARRVGRGIAAGRGKTAGRGTKGQGARKSGGVRPGFEGGQTPIYMRLPHLRGFKSYKPASENVFTGQLDSIKKAVIDNSALAEAGIIANPHTVVKLLLKGNVKSKKTVKLQAASKGAIKAVQAAGGTFEKVPRMPRPGKKSASQS